MPQSEVSKSGSHNVEQSPTRPVLGLDLLRSIHLTLEKLSTAFLLPLGRLWLPVLQCLAGIMVTERTQTKSVGVQPG